MKFRLDTKEGDRMEELERNVKTPIMMKAKHTRVPVIRNKDFLKIKIKTKLKKDANYLLNL